MPARRRHNDTNRNSDPVTASDGLASDKVHGRAANASGSEPTKESVSDKSGLHSRTFLAVLAIAAIATCLVLWPQLASLRANHLSSVKTESQEAAVLQGRSVLL